jgi:hypothetical protein
MSAYSDLYRRRGYDAVVAGRLSDSLTTGNLLSSRLIVYLTFKELPTPRSFGDPASGKNQLMSSPHKDGTTEVRRSWSLKQDLDIPKTSTNSVKRFCIQTAYRIHVFFISNLTPLGGYYYV